MTVSEREGKRRMGFLHEVRAFFFYFLFPQIYMAKLECVLVTVSIGPGFMDFFN